MGVTELVIRSEEDAWKILKDAVTSSLPTEPFTITVSEWPVVKIKLEGPEFNSSLTPSLMVGFIELQRNINRTYAKLRYGHSNAGHLTDEEKAALEIMVQVNPGSSEIFAILEKAAIKLTEGAMNSMTHTDFVIVAVAAILSYGGSTVFKAYLERRKEEKMLDMQRFTSEQETKRMEIFSEALRYVPAVADVQHDAEESYNRMLKGAVNADVMHIAGHRIVKNDLVQLVRPSRTKSTEVRLDGIYRILKVDSSRPDHFKVEVRGEDGRTFTAKLDESVLTVKQKNRELLQEAEWRRQPILLTINGTELRGEISQATIIDVPDRYRAPHKK